MRVVPNTIRRRIHKMGRYHVGVIVRWKWLRRAVAPRLRNGASNVLDAASGDGAITFRMAREFPGARFHGVDLDAAKVVRCRDRAAGERLENVTFEPGDLLDLRGSRQYDLICSLDTLEHIGDDVVVIRRFAESLKPGGWLVVHVPLAPQRHWLRRFDLDRRKNPLHEREGYRPGELEQKVRQAGLEPVTQRYTHGRWGTLAWDLWRAVEGSGIARLLLYPAIRVLIGLETARRPLRGNCLLLEARKPMS